MKEVTLHQQEQARLHVLNSVIAEEITIGQAAELMDLSERHVRRLLGAYRELGAEALAHGNRGRGPHNAVPEVVAATVVRLAATRYPGANHTHLTELLEEHEDLALSRPTVRRILTRAGMPSPRRRRPPQHRVRRERMPRAGMLLQLDGSHHAWLEQRGPRFALLLAVDDATGAVVHALFRPAEDARGYFLLMEQVLRCSGIPLALYSDRHAVFRASAQQRAGGEASTQFARALAELGVRLIFARSPQAKGRVERMAGTFQDRLVTELRLASATTIGEAQAVIERFLPRFNARFAVRLEPLVGRHCVAFIEYEDRAPPGLRQQPAERWVLRCTLGEESVVGSLTQRLERGACLSDAGRPLDPDADLAAGLTELGIDAFDHGCSLRVWLKWLVMPRLLQCARDRLELSGNLVEQARDDPGAIVHPFSDVGGAEDLHVRLRQLTVCQGVPYRFPALGYSGRRAVSCSQQHVACARPKAAYQERVLIERLDLLG